MIRCSLLAVALLAAAPSLAFAEAIPGKAAPDFTAIDSNGKPVKLSALKGKTVVLEWTNHECPYVRKHYGAGNMQTLQREATGAGVVWLTVASSAKGKQGFVEGLEANKLTDDRKANPTAVLLDAAGTIGKAYGATATPHMFVIAPDGVLAYAGAVDDRPTSNPGDIPKARSYVRDALAAVAAGKPMSPSQTRSYGCSVKYTGS
jgi:peroxiredoxin